LVQETGETSSRVAGGVKNLESMDAMKLSNGSSFVGSGAQVKIDRWPEVHAMNRVATMTKNTIRQNRGNFLDFMTDHSS
jgi:hypothetical protein